MKRKMRGGFAVDRDAAEIGARGREGSEASKAGDRIKVEEGKRRAGCPLQRKLKWL